MSDVPHCHCCGEVIGVYEPLVTLFDGHVYEGSRALIPGCLDWGGEHYHRACYERLPDPQPLTG
jgi:hypothetical protein